MRNLHVGVLLGVAAGSAGAQTVIDFESLTQHNANINTLGDQHSEDGFSITKGVGESHPFVFFGTAEFRFPGSTALLNNTVNGRIILAKDGGGTFDLTSMKLALLNGPGIVEVSFTGFLPGGGQVNQNFQISDLALPLDLQKVNFSGFDGVERVEWTQADPFHQFDDITLGAPCYPDCDTTTGVGNLDIFDFLCFQNRFSTGAPYACDCDLSTGPGACDIFDFLCFQNAYDAGCS